MITRVVPDIFQADLPRKDYLELLLDLAATDGNLNARLDAMEKLGLWLQCNGALYTKRYTEVRAQLVRMLVEVARDERASLPERVRAALMLSDKGLVY